MQFMASGLYQLTPAFALMGNLGWQNWSQFGQTQLGISAQTQKTLAVDLHCTDTLRIAFGGQYRIADRWLWSAGFAYDSAPVSEENRTPTFRWIGNLGTEPAFSTKINDDFVLGIANEVMDGSNAPYDIKRRPLAGRVQRDFSSNIINFLGINLVWKLGRSGN
jgi:long-chain fatty acid transport protein